MFRSTWRIALALFMLCALSMGITRAFAQDAALPVTVAPTGANIRYEGRWDTSDAAGPRCSWSASAVHLSFYGSALNVRLNESGSTDEYEVVVDGTPATPLVATAGTRLYSVYRAPSNRNHTITLVKRTEPFCGIGQIQGFQLSEGARLLALPPAPTHKIEVIGDSISCGYGNEGKDQNEHFSPTTENAYLSYGAVAARTLGADYACIALVGAIDVADEYDGEVYDAILPTDPNSRWDFARWTPDVVVINLGTNDFAQGIPDSWITGYEAFITRVRKHYPLATIYAASSPMLWGDKDVMERADLHKVIADENAAGDTRVRFLDFQNQGQSNGFGADWHPSVKTDQIMAKTMASAIETDLGWKPISGR